MKAWFSYPKNFFDYILKLMWLLKEIIIPLGSYYPWEKLTFLQHFPEHFISQFSWRLMWYFNYISQLKLIDVKGEIKFNFKDFHGHWNSQKLIFELIFLSYL